MLKLAKFWNKQRVNQHGDALLKELGEEIAHELNTPLLTLKAGISGIQDCMDKLISAYRIAENNKLSVPEILPQEFSSLEDALINCQKEIYYAAHYVNMLSANLISIDAEKIENNIISIKNCIKKAFYNYPCRTKYQKAILTIDIDFNDFMFNGEENSIVRVFSNLIKYILSISGRDKIEQIIISSQSDTDYNQISLITKGKSILIPDVNNIFDRLQNNFNGLGLYYCKQAMQSIEGDISCAINNDGLEFLLSFPKV